MITIQQINQFREQAKKTGKSEGEIDTFINQKLNSQPAAPFSPKPTQPPVTFSKPEEKPGLLKSVVKSVASPFLRAGATADALGTSKILGGKGADFSEKKTPLGNVKPITSAKDAAGVGLELGATGLGLGGVGAVGKFGSRFLLSGGLGGVFGAGQGLQKEKTIVKGLVKDTAIGAATGAAIPVAGEALKLATRFLGSVAKGVGAGISGTGSDAIEAIIKKPQAARVGLRNDATNTLNQLSKEVRGKVSALSNEASDSYGQALAELPKRLGRTPEILQAGQKTTIKADGKTYTLTMQGVKSKLTKELRGFDVVIDPKNKQFDFLQSPFRKSEENVLKEVFSVIDNWRDTSPKGLNSLAVKIGNFRKPGDQSQTLNTVIDSIKKNVRNYIGERVPAAKVLNQRYAQSQDFIKALDQELATDGAFKGGTAEHISTAKKIATIFNKNKELARELVERMESGSELLAKEAGREMRTEITRSSATMGDLLRTAVQSVIPPKAVGEIAAATGIAQQKIAPILKTLKPLKPAQRTAVLKLLTDALSRESGQQ